MKCDFCYNETKRWRSCGAGCVFMVAVCDTCGGDFRAAGLMRDHVLHQHERPPGAGTTTGRCEVCGKTIREGLRACPGLSKCWAVLYDRDQASR